MRTPRVEFPPRKAACWQPSVGELCAILVLFVNNNSQTANILRLLASF